MARRPVTPATVVGWAGTAVAAAAMVATPLTPSGRRQHLAATTVGGLFAASLGASAARWGWRRSAAAAAGTVVATGALEWAGSTTGVPFGRYAYTGELRPQVAGVPVVVPLAWFAAGLPARAVARGLGPVGGAAALTAWDLFLDPQMVAEGYWRWARPGRYRDIPATNFAGWLIAGTALMAALDRALPEGGAGAAGHRGLEGLYHYLAVMETVGFARYFGDRTVAAVGGAAMGAFSARALWRARVGR